MKETQTYNLAKDKRFREAMEISPQLKRIWEQESEKEIIKREMERKK